jgi:hypothetical protein
MIVCQLKELPPVMYEDRDSPSKEKEIHEGPCPYNSKLRRLRLTVFVVGKQ